MVTQPSRLKMARRAIACFESQNYSNKELVIVSAGDVSALDRPFVRAPSSFTIGDLRNTAMDAARGGVVATWDDDDLSAPTRLASQVATLIKNLPEANACLLTRTHLAWPARHRYGVSGKRSLRGWEPTMVAWRYAVPKYEPLVRGSDAIVVKSMKTVTLDEPSLYTYVFHGENVWDAQHFEEIFQSGELFSSDDPRSVSIQKALG
jgi:glycosyltransferase involved in cell wall biosynthesis